MIKKETLIKLLCSLPLFLLAEDTDKRMADLEKTFETITLKTKDGIMGVKTASTRPESDSCGIFLSVDTLYWQSKLDGIAYTSEDLIFINSPIISIDAVKEPKFRWDFGVKAALGYNLPYDGWDTLLEYTYFKNKASHDIETTLLSGLNILDTALYNVAGQSQSAISTRFLIPGFAATGSSQLTVTLNDLHYELGRDFFVSKRLSLRPNIGLQAAWISLHQLNTFSGGNVAFSIAGQSLYGLDFLRLGTPTLLSNKRNNISSVGPRAGINTHWDLGKGFCFYGDFYQSLLFSYIKVKTEGTFTGYPNNLVINTYNYHRLIPVTAFELGIAYDHYFFNKTQHLTLRIGYENQYFFNVVNFEPNYTTQSLGMYGANFKVRWDF